MTERGKKIRETFLRKYGVEHPSQLKSVKDKIKKKREEGAYNNVSINTKKTLKERYGDENYVNVEKCKQTKLKKYGNKNYNNRDKLLKTNNERYGMNVSPNTLKSTLKRSSSGELGFRSEKFKKFLKENNVTNVSQISSVRNRKRDFKIKETIHNIFNGTRLKETVTPLFSESDYTGSEYNKLYKFKCCKCNGEVEDNLYSGNIPRCLNCYPHNRFKSKIESEILDFLKTFNIEVKTHDRTILKGSELDLYIPSLNLAIECDGIYWHGENSGGKDKNYHINKTKMCFDNNIHLLHVWDWEWFCKKNIIKSILTNKIKKSFKIYARKCEIKTVSESEKISFLEKNHIQGNDKSSIKIGLYCEDKLISLMTFEKSRYHKNINMNFRDFATY